MEKPLLKSKAVWGAILVAAGAIITALGQLFQGTLDFGSFMTTIVPQFGIALGIIGIRFAQK